MFIYERPVTGLRTILHKGTESQFAPFIGLWGDTMRLSVRISTSDKEATRFDSVATIPEGRWVHVAHVVQLEVVRLFINGILDTKVLLPAFPYFNHEPLYVAKSPFNLGLSMFLDDLKIYSRRLDMTDLATIGEDAFPGIGSQFVRLGCSHCHYGKAVESCEKYYHLCTANELASDAKLVARIMGWIDSDTTNIWAHGYVNGGPEPGVALCCKDW